MRLDLAIHRVAAEPVGDRFRREGGCFGQACGIPCLYLVSQRRAVAIRHGGALADGARLRAVSVATAGEVVNPPAARSRLMASGL
jgi:hypothetical protein